jgi:hypothetical protein
MLHLLHILTTHLRGISYSLVRYIYMYIEHVSKKYTYICTLRILYILTTHYTVFNASTLFQLRTTAVFV